MLNSESSSRGWWVDVVAERIEIGDEVAHFAVGVDQVADLHEFARGLLEFRGLGGGHGHPGGLSGQLKAGKEVSPLRIDAVAVAAKGGVLLLDEIGVARVDRVQRHGGRVLRSAHVWSPSSVDGQWSAERR